MNIRNSLFDINLIGEKDILIVCLGYELRSCALLDKCLKKVSKENILCFCFKEYVKNDKTIELYNSIKDNATIVSCKYDDYILVDTIVREFIRSKSYEKIHIDYSSMPRSWYCRLPKIVWEEIEDGQEGFFWYCEGVYPDSYEEYPNAGYEDITLFAGKNSFVTSAQRTHVIGVGFDNYRTEAILNELDPSHFIVCLAYDYNNEEIKNNLRYINRRIIPQAEMTLSFNINDFMMMYSNLIELSSSLIHNGDVVFVPDGPKPLIMAMSLVVQNANVIGLTCLHIHRNNKMFTPVYVDYKNGYIQGFCVQRDKKDASE